MLIGVCDKPENMQKAKDAGFDYLEMAVAGIAAMTDTQFDALVAQQREVGLPCPAFNVLFPGTIALLAPDTAWGEVEDYLNHAFARVRQLGGKTVVFGSGRSRKRPEDMSYADAFRKLTGVTRQIGAVAAQYGLTIVVEPLCRAECNMINYVAEGAALAAAVDHPNVKLLADYYHMAMDGEQLNDIIRVGGVAHTHIATAAGRRYPVEAEDGFKAFLHAMKVTGFDGMLSVEGGTDCMEQDGPKAAELLRTLWQQA